MGFIKNNSTTGAVYATLTRKGKELLLKEGHIDVKKYAIFDTEINYQMLNPDNIDQDDPDILSQTVIEALKNDASSDYSFEPEKSRGILMDNPYFVRQQRTLVGNRLIDSPYYARNQEIILDLSALSGNSDFLGGNTSTTGVFVTNTSFYSITVNIGDVNNSVINDTVVSLYANFGLYGTKLIQDSNSVIFNNLSANQTYKVVVSNSAWNFNNIPFGGPAWSTERLTSGKLQSDQSLKFIGTPATISAGNFTLSGNVTNGITLSTISALTVNLHYNTTTATASTDASGNYVFNGLSTGTQFFVSVNDPNYYYDVNTSVSGTISANTVKNLVLFPTSEISGQIYYYNTTSPISNAIVNLNQGLSSSPDIKYIVSVLSDKDGRFRIPNVPLQRNYNITAQLKGYTFVNTPIQYSSSSVTGSLTGVTIYGRKEERPIIPDSPFPRRRRGIIDERSDYPIFYDYCSWAFYSLKYATIGYSTEYQYKPIRHETLMKSANYFDLFGDLSGPYIFQWNSLQKYVNTLGVESTSAYISDNYTVKVCLYALPYKYSLAENIPQWDTTSQNDRQVIFPLQINSKASDIQLKEGTTIQVVDTEPLFQNQQIAVTINDINKITSMLPRQQVFKNIDVSKATTIPNVGLLHAHGFDIKQDIFNIQLVPFEISQNQDYVSYTSIQGEAKTIPVETIVDDFEEVSVSSNQANVQRQEYVVEGSPLPFFIPFDTFTRSVYFNTNLKYQFSFTQFLNTIRTQGFIFNRVAQWNANGNNYTIGKESAAITIQAVGQNMSQEQILFTPDANFYTISSEFVQFLISYFNITTSDTETINKLFKGKSLIDWLFYMVIVQFGSFYNAFGNGTLSTLLNTTIYTRYSIVYDSIVANKSVSDVANDMFARQYQPSVESLTIFGSGDPVAKASQNVTIATAPNNSNVSTANVANPNVGTTQLEEVAFTFTNSISQKNSTADTGGAMARPNTAIIPPSQQTPQQTPQPNSPVQQSTVNPKQTVVIQYSAVSKILVNAILKNECVFTIKSVYGIETFSMTVRYVIVVEYVNNQVVRSVVRMPIKRAVVSTINVTPIACRIINITNANNYFNLNSNQEKRLKLSLKFDLTNAATQDNFVKMINYLNDRLYTIYLGVEIIDNGNITQNLNAPVVNLEEYINAPVVVKEKFCKSDKLHFMVPLTSGGILQSNSQIIASDPKTYNGKGFIKLVTIDNNISHLIRIVKLSDANGVNNGFVNDSIITASDYIGFDVLQVSNFSNLDFIRLIPRFMQVLGKYNYDYMLSDLSALRNVLANEYSSIPNISYIGSFGAGYGNSTKGPNFWNSNIIEWVSGASPVAMLDKLLSTGAPINVGSVVMNPSEFTISPLII